MLLWNRFMDWPLRAKMAALFVVASLLPLGVATWINIRETRQRMVETTAALLAARGDQLVQRLDTFHFNYQRSAGRIAHLPRVLEFCQARPEESGPLVDNIRKVLEVWTTSDPRIRSVALLDATGRVKFSTEKQLIGVDLSYRRYVQEAMRGSRAISDIHVAESQVGSVPTIAYLSPVLGPDGKVIGITNVSVRAAAFWDLMKASNELAGASSFAVLFDHQGIRIAHTYSDAIIFHPGGRLDPATVDAIVAENRFGEKTRQLLEDVKAFPEQFDRALSDAPDRAVFRGFAPVNQKWNYGVTRRFETVPWTVFYMIPEDALNAEIAQMTRQKTLFAGAILLTALLGGTFFAAAILRPIRSLATATESITGGDLAARVPAGRSDELGRLSHSFNLMAERIQAQDAALLVAQGELEDRVKRRTEELSVATELMRVTETRMGGIVNSAMDAIISIDHAQRVVLFNAAAEKMFRCPASEALGKSLDQFIPPRYREHHHHHVKEFGATGVTSRSMRSLGTLSGIRVGGDEFPIEASISQVEVGGQKTFTVILRDITERNQAEADLRKSGAQLQTIVENINEAVVVSDLDGQLLHFNRAALEMMGYATVEEGRRGMTELVDTFELSGLDGTPWPVDQWPLARILRGEKLRDLEGRMRRIGQDWARLFNFGGNIAHDIDGQPLMAIVTFSDITERTRIAEEIRQMNNELELRVVDRTAQLQTANNELEAFSYSVSHDLRAPLRSLDGFSQALLEDCGEQLDAEGKDNLNRIRKSSQRMGHLIDDLLNLSRLTRVEMSRKTVDVTRMATEIVDDLRSAEPAREVTAVIAPGLTAEADPQLLRIVLTNLLGNAWKFTNKRQDARIELGSRQDEGKTTFFVKDNGAGFDMAYATKLFGAFQRLHSMEEFPGTGIGLATVQRIIHRHGGTIAADSTLGEGAEFRFTL